MYIVGKRKIFSLLTLGVIALNIASIPYSFAADNTSTSTAVNLIQNTEVQIPTRLPDAGTPVAALAKKGVRVVVNSKVETNQPEWIQMATGVITQTGASYWINKLPYEQDRNKNTYIVIPKLGIVSPILDIEKGSVDYQALVKRKTIDYNPYLREGVLRYPTVTTAGAVGNMVIFGHSSYWKSDKGRYKTIFASIPLLEPKDEIWVYTKQKDGTYARAIFVIESSYETTATNTSVMKSTGKKQITLSTCTPIGTAQKRWIVSGFLKE